MDAPRARRRGGGVPLANPRDFGRDGDPALYVIFRAPWGWDFMALRDYAQIDEELPQARVITGTAALAEWASKHLALAKHPPAGSKGSR